MEKEIVNLFNLSNNNIERSIKQTDEALAVAQKATNKAILYRDLLDEVLPLLVDYFQVSENKELEERFKVFFNKIKNLQCRKEI